MTENSRLLELLEQALDSGESPEELCDDHPELLPELRRRLAQCQFVVDELGALFPQNGESTDPLGRHVENATHLPAIPGYESLSILGRGGMGVVYKARHLALNRVVALKMVLSGAHASATERARLKREAEALAKLTHRHIVQVHDVGEIEGRPYFTMEFVEGGSLAEELKGAPQPASRCGRMLINLARAVESAHQRGILHRDLKPANVLLTIDGTPKISDFGLARQVDDVELMTFAGARVGTPSYMAPEQASSRWGEVGRTCDVYALGAILYEMLTGRPPFRGESPADTERQLLHEEVVPPSRLNTRVPRDLETICLKCLLKDPSRRYESAEELAKDLARFENGEPIQARRVGVLERGLKWIRRRPAAATAVAGGISLAMLLAAGTTWTISQRSSHRRAFDAELEQIESFQRNGEWQQADVALGRAATLLSEFGPADLKSRYNKAHADADLVKLLEKIRFTRETTKSLHIDEKYRAALEGAHFGGPSDVPEVVAARIRESNIRYALITALDDWLCFSKTYQPWAWKVLQLADHDPAGWRDHVRDSSIWDDPKALAAIALNTNYADQPVPFLILLADHLTKMRLNAQSVIMLWTRVRDAHPGDFWINYNLALRYGEQKNYPEQLHYLFAAESIHPDDVEVRTHLGNVLGTLNRWAEALTQYREAARLAPQNEYVLANLGFCLSHIKADDEAIPILQNAVQREPNMQHAQYALGLSLQRVGREDEAIPALKMALIKGPFADAQQLLQGIYIKQGRWDQVEPLWQAMIKANPALHANWDGYAEYCLYLGRIEDYRDLRGKLLDRFGQDPDARICDRVGRACLLLGDDHTATARAAAMTQRAVAVNLPDVESVHPFLVIGNALADYRLGNFEAALSALRKTKVPVLRPMPQLIQAMAEYRLGHQVEAKKLLADAVVGVDWNRDSATTHELWICHVLRREAEQTILPNFNAMLDGSAETSDNDERLALLGACMSQDLRGRCAHLWIDAIHAAPDLENSHTEDIARAAASAGNRQGKDAAKYTDEDRTRWRKSAITLLSKRLDTLEALLNSTNPQKPAVRNDLLNLQRHPDLAGLRETAALALLPQSEQDQCSTLWARVRSLLDRAKDGK